MPESSAMASITVVLDEAVEQWIIPVSTKRRISGKVGAWMPTYPACPGELEAEGDGVGMRGVSSFTC